MHNKWKWLLCLHLHRKLGFMIGFLYNVNRKKKELIPIILWLKGMIYFAKMNLLLSLLSIFFKIFVYLDDIFPMFTSNNQYLLHFL